MKLRWLHIILCLSLFTSLQAQDTLQVNRDAEDFVTASLMVAAPGDILYSVGGHACIRMQCPTFDMDYCFSYESEGVSNKIGRFLAGDLKMGMMAVPTQEYIEGYRKEQRGIWEYELNLPIAVKRELWRVLDNRLMEGAYLPYDCIQRGCAISCLNCLKEALDTIDITYAPWETKFKTKTIREICYNNYSKGWNPFLCLTLFGNGVDSPMPPEKKLVVPCDLVSVWQKATVCGEPLLKAGVQVLPNTPRRMHPISPLLAALILCILSLVNLFWNKPYFDYVQLALHSAMGFLMSYLVFFSSLPGTDWNWLLIPFFPLPLLLWRWRSKWAMVYATCLVTWCLGMLMAPHQLTTTAHLLWVMSFILICIKQNTLWQHCRQQVQHYTKL